MTGKQIELAGIRMQALENSNRRKSGMLRLVLPLLFLLLIAVVLMGTHIMQQPADSQPTEQASGKVVESPTTTASNDADLTAAQQRVKESLVELQKNAAKELQQRVRQDSIRRVVRERQALINKRIAAKRQEQERIAKIRTAIADAEHFRVRIGTKSSFSNNHRIGYLEEREDGGVYLGGNRNYFKKLKKALEKANFMKGKGYAGTVYAVNGDEWIKISS